MILWYVLYHGGTQSLSMMEGPTGGRTSRQLDAASVSMNVPSWWPLGTLTLLQLCLHCAVPTALRQSIKEEASLAQMGVHP